MKTKFTLAERAWFDFMPRNDSATCRNTAP